MNDNLTQKSSSAIWWDHVTGPSHLVETTAKVLLEGKSICLITQGGLQFRSTFFNRIANALRKDNNSLLLENATENTDNPEDYLIEHFRLDANYRPHMLKTDFLRNNHTLTNRLLPIVTKNGDNVRDWLDFIKSYKSNSLKDGLFLLEISEAPPTPVSQKYLEILKYDNFITEYDSLLFAGLINDNTKLNHVEKRYITAMAVSFFGTNVECIDDFIRRYKIDQNPFDAIPEKFLTDKDYFADKRLWNAQIQELFPLIMHKTHDFIKTWRENIDEAFEFIRNSYNLFPNGLVNGYDKPINSPDELELATICFLMKKRRAENSGKFVIEVQNQDNEYKKLDFLRKMRNNIAHGKICQPKDVVELLKS